MNYSVVHVGPTLRMGSFADSLLANNVEKPSCPQQYVQRDDGQG